MRSQIQHVKEQRVTRRASASLLFAAAVAAAAAPPPDARARIVTEKVMQQSPAVSLGGFDPTSIPSATAAPRRNPPGETSGHSSPARTAAQDALARLTAARTAAADGRWSDALADYTALADAHPDLALAVYGRLGRAIMLYQLGDVSMAVALLDELEVTERGTPEVHAALAAVLWVERPGQRLRAEQQFDIATEFDRRYENIPFVREQRHWPPRLVAALEQFLQLSG